MSMLRTFGVLVVMMLSVGVIDMLACGDKFLIAGRGTRYQRPKNARAASVLIFADPSSAVAAALKKAKVESVLSGLSYSSGFADLFFAVEPYVWGRDTHDGIAYTVGSTWYFDFSRRTP